MYLVTFLLISLSISKTLFTICHASPQVQPGKGKAWVDLKQYHSSIETTLKNQNLASADNYRHPYKYTSSLIERLSTISFNNHSPLSLATFMQPIHDKSLQIISTFVTKISFTALKIQVTHVETPGGPALNLRGKVVPQQVNLNVHFKILQNSVFSRNVYKSVDTSISFPMQEFYFNISSNIYIEKPSLLVPFTMMMDKNISKLISAHGLKKIHITSASIHHLGPVLSASPVTSESTSPLTLKLNQALRAALLKNYPTRSTASSLDTAHTNSGNTDHENFWSSSLTPRLATDWATKLGEWMVWSASAFQKECKKCESCSICDESFQWWHMTERLPACGHRLHRSVRS
jgi:hypothetical protein